MKSYFGMLMVFLGMYIIFYYDILGFFAKPSMFWFALILASSTLVIGVASLFILAKKRGGNNEEDNNNLS